MALIGSRSDNILTNRQKSLMYKKAVFIALLSSSSACAQVGINNATPDASAELDVKSTTRGFLAPRMTGAQMNAIASPASGLAVYNSDSASYCIYNGTAWLKVQLSTANSWTVSGSDIYCNNTGKVGIGTTAPASRLHVFGGNFVASGDLLSGNTIEVSGAGARMFFNPYRAAFRAGYVYGDEWDEANIGNFSIALGTAVKATGANSVALGNTVTALGSNTFCAGTNNISSGISSTALGRSNTAASFGETVVGLSATTYTPGSTSSFLASDRLFNIGNGNATRSDALTVLKSGNTGLGTSTPTSTLEVNGTLALKLKVSQAAGTNNPDGTAYTWIYSSGTGTITLPTASTCANRGYRIVNNTGATRNTSSYIAFGGGGGSTINNASSIEVVSDGSSWYQVK
jgi:hypothetical protein